MSPFAGQIDIETGLDRAFSIIDRFSDTIPAGGLLMVALAATLMVGWWLIRKLTRLALYAAVVGIAAWFWYFGLPD